MWLGCAALEFDVQKQVEQRDGIWYSCGMKILPSISEMERAVRNKDAAYDGIFFTAVKTTGVFCRPSCRVKLPLSKNLQYFATLREVIGAGYRPCKRCRPLETNGQAPGWVKRLLAEVDRDPTARFSDARLRGMTIEPARARRYFLKHYGLTFQAFCRGRRLTAALRQIQNGGDANDVAFGHGYESLSGFRAAFAQTFGRPPGKSQEIDCLLTSWIESPLGPLIAAASADGICLLEFANRRANDMQVTALRKWFAGAIAPGSNVHLEQLEDELSRYFTGALREFRVALDYPGSPFQRKVWDRLRRIPYGETVTYTSLARDLGSPAARAIGRANGQNRIAILIPCHRVVNQDGQLAGYGGGLWRKKALLELEQRYGARPAL
jgi:AraC family transcriptional regulator of adaptative response/methylated-DNA-[protein]-cysteine methyltransferase